MNDSLLGVISATAFNPDLPDPLPVGNTIYTATVSYTPVAGDPDPITNTVTAEGTGVDSGVEDTDTATCTTDITHEPGIDVTKSCPAEVPFGEAITYTITVQNTGNEPLELVTVNDSLLGVISATAFNPDLPDPLPVGNTVYTAIGLLHAAGRRPRPAHEHGDRDGHRRGLRRGGHGHGVLHHRHHARAGHRRHQVLPGVGAVR